MRFSVEVLRVHYSYVRVDVEAGGYSEASTRGMELAKRLPPDQFQPSPHRKDELRVTSTDKRQIADSHTDERKA